MRYYIISAALAKEIGANTCRIGNETMGYVVNSADLDIQTIADNPDDVEEISATDAKILINKIRKV